MCKHNKINPQFFLIMFLNMCKHNKINPQNLNPLNSFSHARDQFKTN